MLKITSANPKAIIHLLLETYGHFEGQATTEELPKADRIISLLEKVDIVEEVTILVSMRYTLLKKVPEMTQGETQTFSQKQPDISSDS